ncbi:hypothetical protein W97_02562 [Coniosporium apollinis CBS 100218]|uniref:Uncharacterized protein n=1 Tax=Coniosporium apollinis (strain CBS 100218) TaxID=1168221 RepID=R7YN27_CONA1|nr:uncharacterized protein W97_02562 [Coniosporium apollinis CBS 100218]EON63335.1 hypothetical protein W97_02562 [Coniosporium apollinis CBS 100218]
MRITNSIRRKAERARLEHKRQQVERDREADRKFKETVCDAVKALPKAFTDLADAIRQGPDQNARSSKEQEEK